MDRQVVDIGRFMDDFPGPACVIGGTDAAIIASNRRFRELIDGDKSLLTAMAPDGAAAGRRIVRRGPRVWDLAWSAFPMATSPDARLLLGTDVTGAVAERDTLLKELNHRVKNSLQLVTSLLSLHARTLADPAARELFDDAATRVNAIGRVHERLCKGSGTATVDAAEVLHGLCTDLMASSPELPCHVVADSLPAASDRAITLALIATELISNAAKHGRGGPDDPGIEVGLARSAQGARLTVRDHGTGLPDGFRLDAARDSLGLTIVQALAGQLGGRIVAQRAAPGTRWVLALPAGALQPEGY